MPQVSYINKPYNAFSEASKVGANGITELLPLLQRESFNGRFVVTDKGNLSEFLQKTLGDILFNCNQEKVWSIEIKTERENKYNNFFLETWSNRKRYKPGWMVTLLADFLWYFFQKERVLYSVSFHKLKDWAFVRGRLYDFPEKEQKQYNQLNDTWGRCVPIAVIEQEVGFKRIEVNA